MPSIFVVNFSSNLCVSHSSVTFPVEKIRFATAMKTYKAALQSCFALMFAVPGSMSTAQQTASLLGTDAAKANSSAGDVQCCGAGVIAVNATGPRTSPYEPPEANDHSFITDAAPKLDTGCIFRSSGPIIFNIAVTRYLGELNPDGTLKNAAALVDAKVLSKTATLTMPAFDVDSGAVITGIAPERDRVRFNGVDIGFLTGENDVWKLNSFEIPIEKIKFPAQGINGSPPTPAMNEIRIDIDTANTQEAWCTSIDWGALSFKCMSPIILIHGNSSAGAYWAKRQFVQTLRSKFLMADNSIDLATTTVEANGIALNNKIPPLVKSWGVDGIHLVAHSKGGLDAREYLANHQPGNDKTFKVLSFTSISTPHNGSVAADLLIKRNTVINIASSIEYVGFPDYTKEVADATTVNDGYANLTTEFVGAFNMKNTGNVSPDITFNTIAADADRNTNQTIDRSPDEYLELREDSVELTALDNETETKFGITINTGQIKTRLAVNAVYQLLRNTASVTLTTQKVGANTIAVLTSVPTKDNLGNDALVPIPSGLGFGSIQSRVKNTKTYAGAEARNHSSVVNAGVSEQVASWIIEIEKNKGDLK